MHIRALFAEFVGTFAVVALLFGAWLLATPRDDAMLTGALAAGLAIIGMTYGLGQVSGGHFNPVVTIGLVAGGRFDIAHAAGFIVAQIFGATLAAGLVYAVLLGAPAASKVTPANITELANGFGGRGGYAAPSVIALEIVLAALFVIVFMGVTAHTTMANLAPVAIGMTFAACYLVAIPVSNGALNPARSTAAAVFAGPVALSQLWVFWIAPLAGAILGGLAGRAILHE